ncbi:MAG: flavodoxin family protein [Candidatus Bipolaricaulis sp.]|nr:flavodoxin family protein [Candidatus Bipolaricaulis sp.]
MSRVLVLYHPQEQGNTEAKAVAEGARDAVADATLVNTNKKRMKVDEYRLVDVVAFGTSDYFSDVAGGLKVFADDWYIAKGKDRQGLEGRPYGLFYSHGGGGNVREPFEKLFKYVGGKKIGETVESQGKRSAGVLRACHELGGKLAKSAL